MVMFCISDLFGDSNRSHGVPIYDCSRWLEKQLTNQKSVGQIKNASVICLHGWRNWLL